MTKEKIKLSSDQEKAMKLLKSGKNVFVTGEAGTGKSTLINEFRKYLDDNCIGYIACAPTGVAAININGATLHHTFHAPIGFIDENKCDKWKKPLEVVQNAKVIIIDEISMCRYDLFDYVTTYIDQMCPGKQWCNGKQLVVVGDFSQLPPIVSKNEKPFFYGKSGFAFQGRTWKKCKFRTVYLHKILRQSDEDFIRALNDARLGNAQCVDYFNRLVSPYDPENAITLCPKNAEADEINNKRLEGLEGPCRHYIAKFTGDAKKSDFNGVEKLVLKKGARVMAIANDSKGHKYVNGSMGVVSKLGAKTVSVEWDSGEKSEVDVFKWSKHEYKVTATEVREDVFDEKTGAVRTETRIRKDIGMKTTGTIVQIPLKLGYAITIHKSQGNTFAAVNVDITGVFQEGQAYVALSRCSTPGGLHLKKKVWAGDIKANAEINAFYDKCEREEAAIEKQEREAEALRDARKKGLGEDNILLVDGEVAEKIRKAADSKHISISDYLRSIVA